MDYELKNSLATRHRMTLRDQHRHREKKNAAATLGTETNGFDGTVGVT
jgi:hypothetical protein